LDIPLLNGWYSIFLSPYSVLTAVCKTCVIKAPFVKACAVAFCAAGGGWGDSKLVKHVSRPQSHIPFVSAGSDDSPS
jgi:hypothetical protein